jgi:hypothetical protein
MKLEELAGALTELKKKLFISIQEESAAGANEALLSELRERIMTKQPEQIKKKIVVPKQIIKSTDKKLNEQQSKFLKTVPEEEIPEKPQQKRVAADSIQLQKSENGYIISIDSDLPVQLKNLAKPTSTDTKQYMNIIRENATKQLDQLL